MRARPVPQAPTTPPSLRSRRCLTSCGTSWVPCTAYRPYCSRSVRGEGRPPACAVVCGADHSDGKRMAHACPLIAAGQQGGRPAPPFKLFLPPPSMRTTPHPPPLAPASPQPCRVRHRRAASRPPSGTRARPCRRAGWRRPTRTSCSPTAACSPRQAAAAHTWVQHACVHACRARTHMQTCACFHTRTCACTHAPLAAVVQPVLLGRLSPSVVAPALSAATTPSTQAHLLLGLPCRWARRGRGERRLARPSQQRDGGAMHCCRRRRVMGAHVLCMLVCDAGWLTTPRSLFCKCRLSLCTFCVCDGRVPRAVRCGRSWPRCATLGTRGSRPRRLRRRYTPRLRPTRRPPACCWA